MVEVIMSVITVRIDRETKKRMEQMKEVNWSEVVRRAIRERMNEGDAPNKALAVMLNERFLLESSRSLAKYGIRLQGLSGPYLERVVGTARRNGVSIYDASYLALAEFIGCRLYTADRELLKRLTDADRKRAAHIVDFAL